MISIDLWGEGEISLLFRLFSCFFRLFEILAGGTGLRQGRGSVALSGGVEPDAPFGGEAGVERLLSDEGEVFCDGEVGNTVRRSFLNEKKYPAGDRAMLECLPDIVISCYFDLVMGLQGPVFPSFYSAADYEQSDGNGKKEGNEGFKAAGWTESGKTHVGGG